MAITLYTSEFTNDDIEPLLACRLIPLDKSPDIQTIGIRETLRRIMIGKTVMATIKTEVIESAGILKSVCRS